MILFSTYNSIKFTKTSIILEKGLIKKKKLIIKLDKIKDVEKTGIELPGFKPFYALIPLKGLSYIPERDKIIIYKGYISDYDFDNFEQKLINLIKA